MSTKTIQQPAVSILAAPGEDGKEKKRFDFPAKLSSDADLEKLKKNLIGLGLNQVKDYYGLYENGRLSGKRIADFFDGKTENRKRECAEDGPLNLPFPDLENPKALIAQITERLEGKTSFKYEDEASDEAQLKKVPTAVNKTKREVTGRLNALGNPGNKELSAAAERKLIIPLKDAQSYITKDLPKLLTEVANQAIKTGIIYHQPHHDLTPGVLLLDEIFRALVSKVGSLVTSINSVTKKTGKLDLSPLTKFVNGLGGVGGQNEFASFILPGGEHLAGFVRPVSVDSTRVELFFDRNYIRCAAVIVGAWAGGTHSAGHNSG